MKPKAPLPAPLKGSDEGSFAQYSVTVRLRGIGERILKENSFPLAVEQSLKILFDEIPYAGIRPLPNRQAPDASSWEAYLQPYLGQNWLEIPWFLAETYFYRRVLEATQYFSSGEGQGYDPYFRQKRLGLETNPDEIDTLARQVDAWLEAGQLLLHTGELLRMGLWGNQSDLSMWPAGGSKSQSRAGDTEDEPRSRMLVDDTGEVEKLFSGNPFEQVHIVLDNAGVELVGDLCMADALLSSRVVQKLCLHVKMHPTFVSDAIEQDVLITLDFLSAHPDPSPRALSDRLLGLLSSHRLELDAHPYWTSPLAGWEMPPDLYNQLAAAGLVISKGDANYRRWLGDRHWPFTTPVADVLSYVPAPLLALRVVKSEVMVGLQPGQEEAVASLDPKWLVDGKWGMIQFQA